MAQNRYITVAELSTAFDARVIQDLSGDTNTEGQMSETNPIALNAIDRASADVERYALMGGRYSIDSLTTLRDDDDWTLKGLVCSLAVIHLYSRRGGDSPPDIQRMSESVSSLLEKLSTGAVIFNDPTVLEASKPDVDIIQTGARSRFGMVSDSQFFPVRRYQRI